MEVADTNPIGEKNKHKIRIAHIADRKQGKSFFTFLQNAHIISLLELLLGNGML